MSIESLVNSEKTFEVFLRILNEAYAADPAAIHSLICNRVPCNFTLAEHPTVEVCTSPVLDGLNFTIGILGIINGICVASTGKRIALKFSELDSAGARKIIGFQEYKE